MNSTIIRLGAVVALAVSTCVIPLEAQWIRVMRVYSSDRHIYSWNGISPDGTTVAGTHSYRSGGRYPFVWSATEGFRYLTREGGLTHDRHLSFPAGVAGMTGNGTIFGGRADRNEVFRWRPGQGYEALRTPSGSIGADLHGASWDGSVVVGMDSRGRAVVWDANGIPRTIIQGSANDVTPDGRLVVGDPAFLWTEETGIQYLPVSGGTAYAVSADGRVVVGVGRLGSRGGAFRWTPETGTMIITPTGWEGAYATQITADGQTIYGWVASGGNIQAFRWTESGGFQLLSDVYRHILPANMHIESVMALTPDGRYLIGNAVTRDHDFMYVLDTVPEPSSWLALAAGLSWLGRRRKRRG